MARLSYQTVLKSCALISAILFSAIPSYSVTQELELPALWYEALEKADVETLDNLLSVDAKIIFNDLEVTQTKAEFLDSMDDWKDAIEGGSITTRNEDVEAGKVTLAVCYHFTNNEILVEEVLLIDIGKIVLNTQTEISADCSDRDL